MREFNGGRRSTDVAHEESLVAAEILRFMQWVVFAISPSIADVVCRILGLYRQ